MLNATCYPAAASSAQFELKSTYRSLKRSNSIRWIFVSVFQWKSSWAIKVNMFEQGMWCFSIYCSSTSFMFEETQISLIQRIVVVVYVQDKKVFFPANNEAQNERDENLSPHCWNCVLQDCCHSSFIGF